MNGYKNLVIASDRLRKANCRFFILREFLIQRFYFDRLSKANSKFVFLHEFLIL